MFKTLARYRALFRFLRSRRPADAINPIPANDNRLDARRPGRESGTLRCQWHRSDDGRGLAMRWLHTETPVAQRTGSTRSRRAQRAWSLTASGECLS